MMTALTLEFAAVVAHMVVVIMVYLVVHSRSLIRAYLTFKEFIVVVSFVYEVKDFFVIH